MGVFGSSGIVYMTSDCLSVCIIPLSGCMDRCSRYKEWIQQRKSFFYSDDSIIASTRMEWLHGAFDIFIGLFNHFRLWKNTGKTVGMVCLTCRVFGKHSDLAYGRQMMG